METPPTPTQPPRLRLTFEDRKILSKSQRSNGLKQSWVLLKPQFHTISDLSSHLLHAFRLHRSCPNGILLAMDDFVLPPFESTSILKDKDIIQVKKRGSKSSDIVNGVDGVKSIEEVEVVDKRPVLTDVPLLEFDKEIGGYQSEEEEDEGHQSEQTLPVEYSTGGRAASKKRKATKSLQSPERKKRRSMASEAVEVNVPKEDIEEPQNERVNKLHKKNELRHKLELARARDKARENNEIGDPMTSSKRCSQFQENDTCDLDVSDKPDETKKTPSRNSRRKKAKRQWLRELSKEEKQELVERRLAEGERRKKAAAARKGPLKSRDLDVSQSIETRSVAEDKLKKSVPKKGLMALFPDRSRDMDDEVVPVVIRPGHIRFEPLGDNTIQQHQVPPVPETFQLNGTDNKKKGKKWGKEKLPSSRRNVRRDVDKERSDVVAVEKEMTVSAENGTTVSVENGTTMTVENGTTMTVENGTTVAVENGTTVAVEKEVVVAVEKETTVPDPIDFDKLAPVTSSLKEGDVIAYRLLELSSDWTPEPSSFRVGKTSFHDPESNKVALQPVSKYPIISQKVDGDMSSQQPDNVYKEDGSLEIDFSSLLDIRLVVPGKMNPAKALNGVGNDGPAASKDVTSGAVPQNSEEQAFAPTPEKEVSVWDELCRTISAKKAQLSQENSGRSSVLAQPSQYNSGRSSGSYRAPRGRALGPTMARFRSRNAV